MATPQEIKLAFEQHGSQTEAARALNISESKVRWGLYKAGVKPKPLSHNEKRGEGGSVISPTSILKVTPVKVKGLSREQFAASFDNDTRIRNALRAGLITLTDNSIIEDAEFRAEGCRHAPSSGWRRISEEPEFSDYRFTAKGHIFWGTPATKKWALENVEGVT